MNNYELKLKVRRAYLIKKAEMELEAGWKDLATGLALVLNSSFSGIEGYLESAKDMHKFFEKSESIVKKMEDKNPELKGKISIKNTFSPTKDGGNAKSDVNIDGQKLTLDYTQKGDKKNFKTELLPKGYSKSREIAKTFKDMLDKTIKESLGDEDLNSLRKKDFFNYELHGLIRQESSDGRNTNHKKMTSGPDKGYKASGWTGLTPSAVQEVLKHFPKIKEKYSKPRGKDSFLITKDTPKKELSEYLTENTKVEAEFANAYWDWISRHFDNHHERLYAWINGIRGTNNKLEKVDTDELKDHWYVKNILKHEKDIDKETIPQLSITDLRKIY